MSIVLNAETATKTIKNFEEVINFNPGLPGDWYIDVTDNPQEVLVDHKIRLNRDVYFYETFSNAFVPVFIKDHFLRFGVDGVRRIFDSKSTSVFLYKKTTNSIP